MPLSQSDDDSGLALSAESPVSMIKKETVAAGRELKISPVWISAKTHFFMVFLHLSYRHHGVRNLELWGLKKKLLYAKTKGNEVLCDTGENQG
jgi:hypothetical protein